MLTRRAFAACALCAAATGLVATGAEAAPPPGFKRTILRRTEFPGDRYVTLLVSIEIEPDAFVAWHTHPGVESSYVMSGGGTLQMRGRPDQTIAPGDGFQIPVELPHAVRNGKEVTRLIVNYVVEKDKPLASPA